MSYSNELAGYMAKEYAAIEKLMQAADGAYDGAIEAFLQCAGKVIFVGVGKSAHIGKKLAATFSSTGTPSFFVHATESLHGDAGMVEKNDVCVFISNSGNTKEVLNSLDCIKKIGCKTVAFTAGANSALASGCDFTLLYPKCDEADHLNLAPTVSSTLTLVLGDAIACLLSQKKGFTRQDFYSFHPAGALGQKLSGEGKA